MPFRKYASLESVQVVELKGSQSKSKTACLDKLADFHDYRTDDGYLYARIWAISSRVNKNHDGWPSAELAGGQDILDKHTSAAGRGFVVEASQAKDRKHGFVTFLRKPIFVDHHNSNHKRTRGAIVDSRLHVADLKTSAEQDPYYASAPANHLPPTRVELLLEIDAKTFPKFAEAVIRGAENADEGIDGWSMGCDVDHTVCSICSHKAYSPSDYCNHVRQKGRTFPVKNSATGGFEERLAYEDCIKPAYFEISGVFDPADETALSQEVRTAARNWRASKKTADNPLPQADLTTAPAEVDTTRKERVCPVCGETMEGPVCELCGYEEPPESFQNPDLKKLDPHGEREEQSLDGEQPEQAPPIAPDATKLTTAQEVTSRMSWKAVPHRVAVDKSNEPDEEITKDEDEPTTARSAADVVAAAERSNVNRTAAEPGDPSFKADKRVDVTGVGGVLDASNEQASKAQKQVDVQGKGGTGVEDVSPDRTDSVEKEERITGTPTDTWHGTKDQASPVSDKAFPPDGVTSAKQGVQPGAKEFKADDRVDVEKEVSVTWGQSQDGTDQWTGTDGNGVTRQQQPVTNETFPPSGGVTSHVVACFKLAETEVDLRFIPNEKKFDRVAELQGKSEEFVRAQLDAYSKVRTAGLRRQANTEEAEGVRRLPTLGRQASAVVPTPVQTLDRDVHDAGLFADAIPAVEAA